MSIHSSSNVTDIETKQKALILEFYDIERKQTCLFRKYSGLKTNEKNLLKNFRIEERRTELVQIFRIEEKTNQCSPNVSGLKRK